MFEHALGYPRCGPLLAVLVIPDPRCASAGPAARIIRGSLLRLPGEGAATWPTAPGAEQMSAARTKSDAAPRESENVMGAKLGYLAPESSSL